MSSPFKELATISKEVNETKPIEKVKNSKYSREQIKNFMEKGKQTKKSTICALYIGDPKIGKSGVLLDARTNEDIVNGMKMIIFELNSDQGCDLNKKMFHPNDDNIIILNPWEYCIDSEGNWQPDYISTMEKIKCTIQEIKEQNDPKLKLIGVDGLDIFLSEICESQMRLDENLDAAGGVSMRFWKNRNKFYYDVINMLLDIDVDKYFITHYAQRSRDKDTGMYNDKRTISKLNDALVYNCQKSTADKMHQIVEFKDATTTVAGKKNIKIIATLVGDRRSLNSYMSTMTIAESGPDGKVKWNGKAILEREWS